MDLPSRVKSMAPNAANTFERFSVQNAYF